MISTHTIDDIKGRIDLAHWVQRDGVSLKKVGLNLVGLCPFHSESTPSLTVFEDGHYHCFGCHAHGDLIDWVQARQGLDFGSAIELLARAAGIELHVMTPEQRQKAQTQREYERGLALAADSFAERLHETPAALDYAHQRGWDEATIRGEQLGYADGRPLPMLQNDRAQSAASAINAWAGGVGGALIYVHRDGGRVVYLSGRAINSKQHYNLPETLGGPRQPYLNNLATLRAEQLILVEGQACAVTLAGWHMPGMALAGSGLTDDLSRRISKWTERDIPIYLIPDSDGKTRIEQIAQAAGPLLYVVDLPDGAGDLNAWAQNGADADAFKDRLEQADTWLDRCIDQAAGVREAHAYGRAIRRVLALLADVPTEMQARYKQRVIKQLGIQAREFDRLLREVQRDQQDSNGFDVIDGCLAHYGHTLCNFSAQITHELTRVDGINQPDVAYTVAGTLADGALLPEVHIPAADFGKMAWVAPHWGVRTILHTPPGQIWQIGRGIQELSMQRGIQREQLYTFTGWALVNGKRQFLTASGGLGADGLDASTRVDMGPGNLSRYTLPQPPHDLRPAIEASHDFLSVAPYPITLPIWIAMYAAPLTHIQPLNAVLWVYGATQSGKSTLTHLALCHFGDSFIQGHDYKTPANWMSTITDIEGALFAAKDVPIVIDDYAPMNTTAGDARSLAKKAQDVIRSVGNRVARGRAMPDLQARKKRPPRGLVIATAENPVVGHSTVGRTIYVPVEPGQIIRNDNGESALDIAQRQAQEGLYAAAMAGYACWLAKHWDELAEQLPRRIEAASRVGRRLFPHNQHRLADYYGLFRAALDVIINYFCDAGAFTRTDADEWIEIYDHYLIEWLLDQGEQVSAQEPTRRFWEAIGDLMAQGRVYLAPNTSEPFIPPSASATLIGWMLPERRQVYLMVQPALAEVKSYTARLDERFDILTGALRRALHHQGYITERDPDQYERAVYISPLGKNKRVLVIDAQAVEEKVGVPLLEENHREPKPYQ